MNEELELARIMVAEMRTMLDGMYPKKCACCGRVYHDLDEFLADTSPVGNGAISMLESIERDDFSIVDLNRNCACGSTLTVISEERRDMSQQGRELRQRFGAALDALERRGISHEVARRELLKMVHGEKHDLAALLVLPENDG